MGSMNLEKTILYDSLKPGDDPTYTFDTPVDVCYLGLDGKPSTDFKCSKITLPMLKHSDLNWEKELRSALKAEALRKDQKHVGSVHEAILDLTMQTGRDGIDTMPNSCFFNLNTKSELFKSLGHPDASETYLTLRRSLELDLPNKMMVLIPDADQFGALSIAENHFNFMFFPKHLFVYHLSEYKVGTKQVDA